MEELQPWGLSVERAGGAIIVRSAPHVVEVSFNRPDKLNAFTDAMYDAILDLCAELVASRETRAVVLRGAGGRAFAAGNDITSFLGFSSGGDGVAYEARIRRVIAAVEGLPQVTIAQVDGICVGGGLAVATACDLRVASDSARFGYPIARTLGNVLSAPIVLRCREVFGDALTREMLLASRLVDAHRAHAVGAVMQVVPASRLEHAVAHVVSGVLRAAPLTIELTKEQLRDGMVGYDPDRDDRRLEQAYGSPDFHEGVEAFTNKRAPRFRGSAP